MARPPHPHDKMRAFLTLIFLFVALTGEGLAGGILFYTSPGASYVSAVQYETISTPTAHLVFVTVKGGNRMQIAASGVVSDIPLPDAARTYKLSEIETAIAQCEMITAQYPKYAASMQQVADMWRSRSKAAAQNRPAPGPASPPTSTATTDSRDAGGPILPRRHIIKPI